MTDFTLISLQPHAQHKPFAATIGFFDGVHLGHRHVLSLLKQEAAKREQNTMVVTFERHPRHVLGHDHAPKLLNTNEEKLALLAECGIDACVMLRFSCETAALTARQFMESCLYERLHIRTLLVGYDHRFGRPDPNEGFAQYAEYGRALGIDVLNADRYPMEERLSSSAVRELLEKGNVAAAARLLTHPYGLSGIVVEGRKNGRKLGFPTANIRPLATEKLVPSKGVYATRVGIGNQSYAAMTNIGERPTLDNGKDITIETHLFDFNQNLYGQTLELQFVERLRSEMRFPSIEVLQNQLRQDEAEARRLLGGRSPQ